ncbi:MAG: hypothetical protein NTX24_01585 [Candidatus Pacearchaeota archaeon]|nr:hypothetical protein [Candidatus Pacearchaeota archaeon]
MNKKGDFQLSFQFIFSIILIAVVFFVGFYVIKIFLDQTEKIKLLDFTEQLKNSDGGLLDIWRQDSASQIISLPISNKIEYVCFANFSSCSGITPYDSELSSFCKNITYSYRSSTEPYNMFFYPLGRAEKYGVKSAQAISCNNAGETLKSCVAINSTANCIKVVDGRVKMKLLKENETSKIQILPVLT